MEPYLINKERYVLEIKEYGIYLYEAEIFDLEDRFSNLGISKKNNQSKKLTTKNHFNGFQL